MSVVSRLSPRRFDPNESSTSTNSFVHLPKIEHPSQRIDPRQRDSLDVRGRSRDGRGDGQIIRNESALNDSPRKRHRKASREYQALHRILEEVGSTRRRPDQDDVRLPVFGRQSDSRSSTSSVENERRHEMSETSRLFIDELEVDLRERVRSQYHDVRAKFRHAAQNEPKGKISRSALTHLIATIFGAKKQVSSNQIDKLLDRLYLKNSDKISFDEFTDALFKEQNLPDWIESHRSTRVESSSNKTATQMFLILKEKVRKKHRDLQTICPPLCDSSSSSRIFKAQLHNGLTQIGYRMTDPEFDKLWDRFDTDGFKAVSADKFAKILLKESVGEQYPSQEETKLDETRLSDCSESVTARSDANLKTPRPLRSRGQFDENQVQNWLSHKFPQGFSDLELALERLDTKQTGTLPRDRFLEELKRFGLRIDEKLLDFFLKRLNVDLSLTNDGIPYRDVINAFKQKSDRTRKRINADNRLPPHESRQTSLERQIDLSLAMNYERVRDLFHRLDLEHDGTISSNELRAVIEDCLEYTLKPDEYYQLVKSMPLDENQRVKYQLYLKQVLDRTLALQEEQQKSGQLYWTRTKTLLKKIDREDLERRRRNDFNENSRGDVVPNGEKARSIDELRQMLKSLIRNRYKDIEDQFKRLDRASYGELTQDRLYELFARLAMQPRVTRAEVDLIWSHCHLKENGNLDFYQFLREFGYSKRSAHYPNAKQNPPRRGDADFLLTSRKLYGDSVLVHGAALNAIRSNWDQLRREFAELDPYRTGFLHSDEFDEILTQLCPSVNQDDLGAIKSRFRTENDSRINYVHFLKHHAPVPQWVALLDEPSSSSLASINQKPALSQLSSKLRRKLSDSVKQLRRAFKQRDLTNSGTLPAQTFKQILVQFKCPLDDEEFYLLSSQIDTKIDGTIDYNYFLQQYVKNN